jgi:membrane protein
MPFKQQWRRARRFLQHDLWHPSQQEAGESHSFLVRLLRIVVLAARGFAADALHLRASALTYYTLLSIVPALALAFGIAKGFGLEEVLRRALQEQLAGQQEVLDRAITFADSLLESTRGGVVAGVVGGLEGPGGAVGRGAATIGHEFDELLPLRRETEIFRFACCSSCSSS